MSRIILSKYKNGEEHFVVGYDAPLSTFFWQEFNQEPEDWDALTPEQQETWEEVLGFAGYIPNELREYGDLVESVTNSGNQTLIDAFMLAVENHDLNGLLKRHKTLTYPESNEQVDLTIHFE